MPELFDVGYQSIKSSDLLIQAVEKMDAILVDVRYSPKSKDAQWSGAFLAERLGKRYVHMPELGNKNYKGDSIELANPKAGIPMLYNLLQKKPVIIMCACWNRNVCHRKAVAKWIETTHQITSQPLTAADVKRLANMEEQKPLIVEQGTLFSGE